MSRTERKALEDAARARIRGEQPQATDDRPPQLGPLRPEYQTPILPIQATDDRVKEQGSHAEWTREFVENLMLKSQLVDQPAFGTVIADAHNAALAAERERVNDMIRNYEDETYQALLQAQAAIAQVMQRSDAMTIPHWICVHLKSVDLSALDKFKKDTERMDWLDGQKRKHAAHWSGHGWVNPRVYWTVSREIDNGTYEYPIELSNLTIRQAIDEEMK